MREIKYITKDGTEAKMVQVDGALFESEPKEHILHAYIKAYANNQRQGNASTLNRARMRGGGRKPFRQKGTGRARAGSNTSPLWTGGAVIWGPTPKDHYRRIPKKLKKSALQSALSLRAKEDGVKIVELPDVDTCKTRFVADYLKKIGLYHKRTILLYEGRNENLETASRNIKYFTAKRAQLVNAYDLLLHENVLVTDEGLSQIREIFGQ